jgi:hypothetical protein
MKASPARKTKDEERLFSGKEALVLRERERLVCFTLFRRLNN